MFFSPLRSRVTDGERKLISQICKWTFRSKETKRNFIIFYKNFLHFCVLKVKIHSEIDFTLRCARFLQCCFKCFSSANELSVARYLIFKVSQASSQHIFKNIFLVSMGNLIKCCLNALYRQNPSINTDRKILLSIIAKLHWTGEKKVSLLFFNRYNISASQQVPRFS